jgi:photosystem II stability/assembly factor-like uncharacterized protein
MLAAMLLLLVVLSGHELRAQPPGNFRILGPGGGGAMFHPNISPHDPQTVMVSCDMSGVYITHNGGQSWRMINLRGVVRDIVFDPVDPKIIYVLGIGLWQSPDEGATWRLLSPPAAAVHGVTDASDEAEVYLLSRDQTAQRDGTVAPPRAFAVDPADHKRLYMAQGTTLWSSKDGGAHWGSEGNLPSQIGHLALLHKPGDHGAPEILMASDKGLWTMRGQLASPENNARMTSESLDVVDGKVLMLVGVNKTLYQASVDITQRNPQPVWKMLKLPGEGARVTTAASAHDGRTLYVSYSKLKLDGQEWGGIARSDDMGEHWTLVLKDADRGTPPNFTDGWIASVFGSWWGEEPLGLAVSDKDHALIYATDLGRTIKSTDGGGHWSAVYSHTGPDGGAVSNGLDVLISFGVYFDPFNPNTMFVPYSDVGLMRSDNRGESWWNSTKGAPQPWRGTTYAMAFDPAIRGRVWAAMARTHDLPRARMLRKSDGLSFRGGVCVSSDGGRSWTKSSDGMPEAAATHILLDPNSPASSRTLYVATMGRGVFKSVNGGKSWTAKNNGITQAGPFAWRLNLASDGTLYALIARKSERSAIGSIDDGALYRSRNGAENWERVALPEGVNAPNGLAVDPREPARMYLAAWPRETGQHGAGGGIYGTTDGGAHWKPLFTGNQHIFDVTWNQKNPSELYATGFESSAWHSTDRGEHWQRIAGYDFRAGHRVTPDPANPGMIYINTFGGGVWYGRVDAKPGVEDIVSKEIAP